MTLMDLSTDADDRDALHRVRRRMRLRLAIGGIVVAAAMITVFVVTLSTGPQQLSAADVVSALVGRGTPATELVVVRLRMPRAVTALLVGLALGLAGALFQRVLHNTLASPDVVGVGAGASVGAVTASVTLGLSGAGVSAAAVLGAVAATLVIGWLARRDGVQGIRFVLIGIGCSSAMFAVVSWQLIRASLTSAQENLIWLTGSVTESGWSTAGPLAVSCAVLIPVALVLARALPRLELGDDVARGLGLPATGARVALLGVGVLLVAAAVAAAGPVSFVALVAGPVAARLTGAGSRSLPHAAGVGAVLVLSADLVARTLLADVALPVGVVTGALGAPYLLWLLTRDRTGVTA